MQLLPDKEFDVPRIHKTDYGEYENNNFRFRNIKAEDDYFRDMVFYEVESEEKRKEKYAYEKSGRQIYHAIKGQVEPVVWDALATDPDFSAAIAAQCPIQILEVLAKGCLVVNESDHPPMARVELLQATLKQCQRPKGGPGSMSTSECKIYVQAACKAGGSFTFGTNYWEPLFEEAGITIRDYFHLSAAEKKAYDAKAQDRIVADMMIRA